MKLDIVKVPNSILRSKSKPVTKITPDLSTLAKNMLETMYADNGIGLAAPQVGQSSQLIVTGLKAQKSKTTEDEMTESVPETILFNPKIIKRSSATDKATEACLSLPDLTGVVQRSTSVTVQGLDLNSKSTTINATGFYARVLQHEIDHLEGVLFTDRLEHYRVVFFGTSDFAVPTLNALIKHPQFDVVAVVTEADKPAGRHHILTSSPVKQAAAQHHLPIFQPKSLNPRAKDASLAHQATTTITALQKLQPDFLVLAAYGKILPREVLALAKYLPLNIHPSLLPKHRGASPIQTAILKGESETGISVMVMVPEMDAGPIISMYKHQIEPTDTFGTLTQRLGNSAAWQLIITLEELVADKAEMFRQDQDKATYTTKIEPEQTQIDWTKPAAEIDCFIRAYSPKPGAWTEIEGVRIKILSSRLEDQKLKIDQIVIPGKKAMNMKDLRNGYRDVYDALIKHLAPR